jgi:hypothetical protein
MFLSILVPHSQFSFLSSPIPLYSLASSSLVFLPSILAILALVPVPAVRHGAVRVGGASLGAFGVVLGSSVLAKTTSWENVWERLWVSGSEDWGTPQEKGLSAAYAVLVCAGVVTDWALKRKFGENPDEVRWKSLRSA